MTGLNPDRDRIIEIATVVTDKELTVLAEGPVLAIHQTDEVLGAWTSGTRANTPGRASTERVRASTTPEAEAEQETLAFMRQYVDQGASPICGNSICQDRRFLIRHMPELAAFFHYRNLDVSTLKILVKLWMPEVGRSFREEVGASRARRHPRLDPRAAVLSRAAVQADPPRRRIPEAAQKTLMPRFPRHQG